MHERNHAAERDNKDELKLARPDAEAERAKSLSELANVIFECIEVSYNRCRSSVDYFIPIKFELRSNILPCPCLITAC